MKKFALLAVLLVPTLGLAKEPAPSIMPGMGDKLICRSIAETDSRLSTKRICMFSSEWDEQRRLQQKEIKKIQASPSKPGT